MSGHTPGPWVADKNVRGHLLVGTVAGRMFSRVVARIAKSDEQSANAHLISAAPELLAVCVALLAKLDLKDAASDISSELVAIEAAIAKAEGREKE